MTKLNLMKLEPQFLEDMDRLIRSGQHSVARQSLLLIPLKTIERDQKTAVADLARRLNMPKVMIAVLRDVVFNTKQLLNPATHHERALYAVALARLGVFKEAEQRMTELKGEGYLEADFYLAQNHMLQWQYSKAIPFLKNHLKRADLSEYQTLVGQVNLVSSYQGNSDWSESRNLLTLVMKSLQNKISQIPDGKEYSLLYGNCLEQAAFQEIFNGRIEMAEVWLMEAQKLLGGSQSRYELFVKKWSAILRILKPSADSDSFAKFEQFRKDVHKSKNWETIRELDFYLALAKKDESLFWKVFFGTPFLQYRKRIQSLFKPDSRPLKFQWQSQIVDQSKIDRTLDLSRGEEIGSKVQIRSNAILHQLLQILCRDFYRPVALGAIFSELFPNEHYDPDSSPQRVYQSIIRLRKWFRDHHVPLRITSSNWSFRLKFTGNYAVQIQMKADRTSELEFPIEKLVENFGMNPFSAKAVSEKFDIPLSRAQKYLSEVLKLKKIRKTAGGSVTKYKLVESVVKRKDRPY